MLSLLPTAVLSIFSWYPFGYVRYERYAVIGLALMPAIGAQSIWKHFIEPHKHKAKIRNVLIVFASAFFSFIAWNWTIRGYNEIKQTEHSEQLLSTLKKELQSAPLVADFWSQETVWLTGSNRSPQFLIPRPVLVNQRDWTKSEQEQISDLCQRRNRIVILLHANPTTPSGKFRPAYEPLFRILSDHEFQSKPSPGQDPRLSVWTRIARTP